MMTMELQDARMSVIRVDQVFAASAEERHSGGALSLVLFSGAVLIYTYPLVKNLMQDLQDIKVQMNLAPWVSPSVPTIPQVPSFPDPFPWNSPAAPLWYKWVTTSDSSGVYQATPETTDGR